MRSRIHILVDEADKVRYARQAEREGKSLGEWLREAAEEKLAASASEPFRTADELDRFFAACDDRESHPEPDWDEHRKVIERSRGEGVEVT